MKYLTYLLVFISCFLCSCSTKDDIVEVNDLDNLTSKYFTLNEESLNGWDFGVSDGEYCITTKNDDNGGTTVCAIDTKSGNDYSFWVDFDNNGDVIGFATPTTYYSVKEEGNEYLFYSYKDGELSFFSVKKSNEQKMQSKSLTRATWAGNIIESIVEGTYNVFDAGRNTSNLGTDLHEGRWGDFFKDLGNLIGNNIIDKLQNGGLLGVLVNEQINFLQNQLNQHNSEQLYGNAQIKITSIDKQFDESYSVNAEVTGLSSIQTLLAVVSETSYQEVTNHVYAGVVCRKSYSAFINYYTQKAKEVEVTGGGSEMYIAFKLPKLEKGTYYVKPYLRSSINDIIKNAGFSYINYGQEKEIHIIGGKINKIEQIDANCTGGGNATIVLYADAEVDSNEGLEDWGVYYEKDGQYHRFSASWATSKVREDVRMEINLSRSEFDYVDYDYFTASKEMSFGIFKKYKNSQGVYDYGYYEYGDKMSYTLTYDKKPSFELLGATVTDVGPYDGGEDIWDRYCNYEYSIALNGCLFINSLINNSGANWHSAFGYTLVEGPEDNFRNTISNSYLYFAKGTKVGEIKFAAVLGNGVYYEFPGTLYCDNGTVYTGGSASRAKVMQKTTDSVKLFTPKHIERN